MGYFDELPDEWIEIHDFLYGYGYRRKDKTIFAQHAAKFLQIDIFREDVDLDEVYEKIQKPMQEYFERRRQWAKDHPFNLKKITIPKVNRAYPEL
jgi:lipoate-protein ligase A